MNKRFNCEDGKILFLSDKSTIADGYIKMLNRGGLLIPSSGVCPYSIKCFAILDVIHDVLIKHVPNNVKTLLNIYIYISNTYFNNQQKISNVEIRKDDVKKFKARQTEKDECTVVKRLVGCCSSYVPVCF